MTSEELRKILVAQAVLALMQTVPVARKASQAPGNATNGEAVGRPDPRNPT